MPKKAQVGDRRNRKGGTYEKQPSGKWKLVKKQQGSATTKPTALKKSAVKKPLGKKVSAKKAMSVWSKKDPVESVLGGMSPEKKKLILQKALAAESGSSYSAPKPSAVAKPKPKPKPKPKKKPTEIKIEDMPETKKADKKTPVKKPQKTEVAKKPTPKKAPVETKSADATEVKKPPVKKPEVKKPEQPSKVDSKTSADAAHRQKTLEAANQSLLSSATEHEGVKRIEVKTKEERELISAVTLYTDPRGFDFVMRPEQFPVLSSKELGVHTRIKEKGERMFVNLDQASVDKARKDVEALASAPAKNAPPLYRGMRLPHEAAKALKAGSEFELGPISSWSSASSIAHDFSGTTKDKTGVVFQMAKPKKGTDVSALSSIEHEKEFITSGRVRIKSVQRDGNQFVYVVEQI